MSTKKTEVWIHVRSDDRDDAVELRISRERLARALLGSASETAPIVIDEAWANGDSAKVIVQRIPWREAPWRVTAEGWIRGPYRVWYEGGRYYAEGRKVVTEFHSGPHVDEHEAMRAAMEHADQGKP